MHVLTAFSLSVGLYKVFTSVSGSAMNERCIVLRRRITRTLPEYKDLAKVSRFGSCFLSPDMKYLGNWFLLTELIRLHHMHSVHKMRAYCYRRSSVVCVSMSAGLFRVSSTLQRRWTDRDVDWMVDSAGPKEPCIRWCPDLQKEGTISGDCPANWKALWVAVALYCSWSFLLY